MNCLKIENRVRKNVVYREVNTGEVVVFWESTQSWLSVDPLADKYPSLSPYVYCANNPVILVDPDGRKIVIAGSPEFKKAAFNDMQKLSSSNLVMLKSGQVVEASKYKGDGANIVHSGTGAGNKETGTAMISRLAGNQKHTVTIKETSGENNSYLPTGGGYTNAQKEGVGSGGTVSYDPNTTGYNIVNADGTTKAPAYILLGHELIHADNAMEGKTLSRSKTSGKTDPDGLPNWREILSPEEVRTRKIENIIRKENDVKPRATPE